MMRRIKDLVRFERQLLPMRTTRISSNTNWYSIRNVNGVVIDAAIIISYIIIIIRLLLMQ